MSIEIEPNTIELLRDAKSWLARFHQVTGMPDALLPLPFTRQADALVVYHDIRRRFPDALVVSRHLY